MNTEKLAIPNDLISTSKAAEMFGFCNSSAIRYYVHTKKIKGYKDRRGRMFISESEFRNLIPSDDFQIVN